MGINLFKIQTYQTKYRYLCIVNKDKKFWCDLIIWGELYGDVHIMDDRQISESPQEVHKKEED